MSKFSNLHRRTFLRGAGAAMALPLLEGMPGFAPRAASAAGAAEAPPVRLAWVFFPNGVNYERWQVKDTGRDWQPSETLSGLGDAKSDVTVFTGLMQNGARALGDGPGDHARSAAAFLTGAHPVKTDGAEIFVGKSIDQVAADSLGRLTRLPSLELGTEGGRNAGSCDSGYSCAYSNSISWRTPSQPMAKEVSPRLVFERLFGNGGADGDAMKKRLAYRRSILDMVADDASALQKRVGAADRQKLDEYFTTVREVERRVEQVRSTPAPQAPAGFEVPNKPADTQEHIRLMYDLMVLAFQTDSTRVATFMLANEGSNRTYPFAGVKEAHHALSHHQNNEDKILQIAKIDRFLVEEYARFIGRLKATPDGTGTLFDNSLVLYGCAIGDGNRHNHENLPILMAGRGGGAVNPGQHIRVKDVPLNNLYLSMLDSAGVSIQNHGDSTGHFKGLDA